MTSNAVLGVCRLLGAFIFIVELHYCALAEQYIGDTCTLRRTNAPGRCKFLSDCQQAVDDLQSRGIRPQNCGFDGVHPVVCCVEDVHTTKPFPTTIPESKSKQKCKDYREYYAKNIGVPPLSNLPVPVSEQCDFLDLTFIQSNTARPNEFPHLAAIGYDGEGHGKAWLCSGALVSELFVLTAAHCLTDRPHGEPKYIRLGDLDLNSNLDDTTPPQEFSVAEIFIHPKFQPPSFYNDIGLLKMNRPAKLYPNVRPACLDTNPNVAEKKFIAAGWSRLIHHSHSHTLKESLKYFSRDECDDSVRNVTSEKSLKDGIVDETQLCAVPNETETSHLCAMGTGVLQVYNKEEYCMYTIIGVTSFGRTCGAADVPDVFTKVSPYTQWIEGVIWPS